MVKEENPNRADSERLSETKTNLVFQFYKQQRDEMMELGRQSMSITFQVLALMATLALGFWQISSTDWQQLGISTETKFLFKLGISAAIMVAGCIGLVLNINIEGLRVLHIERARAARRAIGFLEEFISASKRTGKTHIFYYFVCIMVVVAGGLLAVLTLLQGAR
jgi:hypothetical protein